MARPIETGLSYFPLDIDFDYDDKFQMILAKHKAEGCWIVLIVLCKIYDEGYFYKWTEKEQLLTSRRVNSNLTTVIDVINDAIHFGIFDKKKYEKFNILTSNGIQKRFFEATKKRKRLEVFSDYLVNGSINSVNSNITMVNSNLTTQRRVKKSKVKKRREEHGEPTPAPVFLIENKSADNLLKAISSLDNIKKLEKQLTYDEAVSLVTNYKSEEITSVIRAMENSKGIEDKNISVYLTAKKWIERDRKGK